MDLDRKALELKESGTPFCRVTVVKVDGSAPGHAGAKMIVTKDDLFGTVGGGGLEHQAMKDAREALRLRSPDTKSYDLTEGGVQPCGGAAELFFEPVFPPKRIVVFGAGHVAERLCPILEALDFRVTLVDERAERLSVGAFKAVTRRVNMLPGDFLPTLDFADDLHIICVTHRHAHDESIARFCLGRPFKYLGVISSRSKWKLFCDRFRSEGFSEEQISRVTAPIGLDIGGDTPAEIAVAIAAQLIQLDAKPEDFARGVMSLRGA